MKIRITLVFVLLNAFPVLAQTQSAARTSAEAQVALTSKLDPAKEADIRHLLELTQVKKLLEQMVSLSLEQMKPQLARAVVPDDRGEKFVEVFLEKFRGRYQVEDLLGMMVVLYDRHFNHEEISELIQFYETPVGRRVVEVLPQIAQEGRVLSSERGQKVALEVLRDLRGDYPEITQMLAPPRGQP